MKSSVSPLVALLLLVPWIRANAAGPTTSLILDPAGGEPVKFAAAEIIRADISHSAAVVIAASAEAEARAATEFGVAARRFSEPQSYAIRHGVSNGVATVIVLGADPAGAMYGGLDVAEALQTSEFAALIDSDHTPHLAQRGIKFNIPLDLRTPSYSDCSDAAQANLPEMWSLEFWRSFLDDMARRRFNVLSLWNLHPFPSIVKVPEFPHVALDDVWRTRIALDDTFSSSGKDMVRPAMLADHEVVKTITIEQKIQFWREVMQFARDRGIDVYWFTWNIFLFGAEGKDGITADPGGPRTIEYFRASVRETIKTYPLLAGIGITAGEEMKDKVGGLSKEQWLWQTYGEGIRDALQDEPQRKFRLIHRFHQTGLTEIEHEFGALPCPLDLSFKYAIAHMYSSPRPPFINPLLPLLSPARRSWLTVRNDDIYSFRWADPEYARAFLEAIPGPDKIAGFYMGSDGYICGRDFLSKDADLPRRTVLQKQWLSFTLWGRLAYEPDLPDATFTRLVAARFPQADAAKLCATWADASKVFPEITRFFWGDIDLKWFPEACLSHPHYKGFYTVRDFIEGNTMPGSGVLNILDWRAKAMAGAKPDGAAPPEIASTLETNAANALKGLDDLRRKTALVGNTTEYTATLGDIEAMSDLGLYYAEKIRGACDLALFDKSGDPALNASAVQHLDSALAHWKDYAAAYTRQYRQPVLYNRVGWVDIPKLTEKAAADVQIARDWKPGTIDETKLKRSGTEKGFRE